MLPMKLMDVFHESFQDDSFRESLLKNHTEALKVKGWELSPDDLQKLEAFMAGNQVAGPSEILEAFSNVLKGAPLPPPPPWQPEMPSK